MPIKSINALVKVQWRNASVNKIKASIINMFILDMVVSIFYVVS